MCGVKNRACVAGLYRARKEARKDGSGCRLETIPIVAADGSGDNAWFSDSDSISIRMHGRKQKKGEHLEGMHPSGWCSGV